MTTQLEETRYASQPQQDPLWEMAKKRAGFKWSLVSYLFTNSMLIIIWFLTSGINSYFWPIWPMLGWGLGLVFQYIHAYHGSNMFSVQQEYEKLKSEQRQ